MLDFLPIEDYAAEVGGFEFVNLNSDLILKLEWTVYTHDGYKVVKLSEYHHIWMPTHENENGNIIQAHGTWYLDTTGYGNSEDFEQVSYDGKFMQNYKHEAQFLTSTCQYYLNQISSYR